MEITFRKAKTEDIEDIVPLMYSAAEDLFEFSYSVSGKNAKDFLKYILSTGKGYYGFQNQTVGIYNNKVVFSVTTYKGKDVMKETLDTFSIIFKFYGILGSMPVIWRSLVMSKIFIPPKKDSLYIANIGTNPVYRGKGIATEFFSNIHKSAKESGINRCELDVSFKNPKAEKLYTKLGYVITKNLPYKGKLKLTGMKRMEKIL